MLLAANPDTEHLPAIHPGRLQGLPGGAGAGLQPLRGILFAAAIGAADQAVGRSAPAQDGAAPAVEDQRLGALGAAVEAEKKRGLSHRRSWCG